MNELKLIKTVGIPEPLEMGFDYAFAGRMAIRRIEKEDNEDGTFTYTHKGQLTHIEVMNKLGKTFKGVAKGSKSQVLRFKIIERGIDYEPAMDKIIENLDEILQKYAK